jgi:hypothetical protein
MNAAVSSTRTISFDLLPGLLKECAVAAPKGAGPLEAACNGLIAALGLKEISPTKDVIREILRSLGQQTSAELALSLLFHAQLSALFENLSGVKLAEGGGKLRQSSVFKLMNSLGEYEAAAALSRELLAQFSAERGQVAYEARISAALLVWERVFSNNLALLAGTELKSGTDFIAGVWPAADRERFKLFAESLAELGKFTDKTNEQIWGDSTTAISRHLNLA